MASVGDSDRLLASLPAAPSSSSLPAPTNILLIVADQLSAACLPTYGHRVVKSPNLDALSRNGVVFERAYCNVPLSGPSAMSLISGQLPSRIEAFDNGSEMHSSVPTFAHYLRQLNYQTVLAGKIDFSGPDRLHGFEERLTPDLSSADFACTPDWRNENPPRAWYNSMLSVAEAGVYDLTQRVDYDEDTTQRAARKLHDIGRARLHRPPGSESLQRPFLLTVSLAHPRDPYIITKKYWDRYDPASIDLPRVRLDVEEDSDGHSTRLRKLIKYKQFDISDQHIRNARQAYYGMISYIDDKVGELLAALEVTGLLSETVVIFTSNHGDMLGERSLWFDMALYEMSARVPLLISCPARFNSARITYNVSLLDIFPTILDLALGGRPQLALADPIDGHSLLPMLHLGNQVAWPDTVLAEYNGEGALQPLVMIRRGQYKYIHSAVDGPQLFNVSNDPDELTNLARMPEHASRLEAFQEEVRVRWDIDAVNRAVLASQRRRLIVHQALQQGRRTPWEFQPSLDTRYPGWVGSQEMSERFARFPLKPAPFLPSALPGSAADAAGTSV